jgi:hypothetical protein
VIPLKKSHFDALSPRRPNQAVPHNNSGLVERTQSEGREKQSDIRERNNDQSLISFNGNHPERFDRNKVLKCDSDRSFQDLAIVRIVRTQLQLGARIDDKKSNI